MFLISPASTLTSSFPAMSAAKLQEPRWTEAFVGRFPGLHRGFGSFPAAGAPQRGSVEQPWRCQANVGRLPGGLGRFDTWTDGSGWWGFSMQLDGLFWMENPIEKLVGGDWNHGIYDMTFPFRLGINHHPNWRTYSIIFQRGRVKTTNQRMS